MHRDALRVIRDVSPLYPKSQVTPLHSLPLAPYLANLANLAPGTAASVSVPVRKLRQASLLSQEGMKASLSLGRGCKEDRTTAASQPSNHRTSSVRSR